MPKLRESDFELVVLSELGGIGFAVEPGASFDPDASDVPAAPTLQEAPAPYGSRPLRERESYHRSPG